MPVFTIELPNGKRIDAEADNEDAALSGAQEWYKQQQPSQPEKTDTSLVSAVQQGAANVMQGVGSTVKNYISKDAGAAIENAAAAKSNPNYKSAYEEFANPSDGADKHLLGVDWSSAPRALLEQAPALATDLLTQMLLKKAGPLVKLAGGALTYGARTAGNEAQKRADARTGETGSEPSTEDKLIGLGSTAAQGALNAYGAGKIVNPAKVTGTGLKGIAQTAGNVAKAATAEGVTNAAQEGISEAAATAGTDNGLSVDPQAVKAAGLMGAVGGGVFGAGRGVKDVAQARNTSGSDFGDHSTLAANRVIDKAGGTKALESPETAYSAVKGAQADVGSELAAAAKTISAPSRETANAIARAKQGGVLTENELSAIDAEGNDGLSSLVRQQNALSKLTKNGSFNDADQRFAGGLSEIVRNHAGKLASVTGGITALPHFVANGAAGMDSVAAALPGIGGALAGGYGAYRALKLAERFAGVSSPARAFAEKFGDSTGQVRSPAPAPSIGPTGPRVTSVNSFTTPQPWGPIAPKPTPFKPDVLEPGLRKIVDKIQGDKQKQADRGARELQQQERDQQRQDDREARGLRQQTLDQQRQADRTARETRQQAIDAQRQSDRDARALNAQTKEKQRQAALEAKALKEKAATEKLLRAEQLKAEGQRRAEALAENSPLVQRVGGLDAVRNPAVGRRVNEILSTANALRKLTKARREAEEAQARPVAPPVAEPKAVNTQGATPQPPEAGESIVQQALAAMKAQRSREQSQAQEDFVLPESPYWHLEPAEASQHILADALAGGKPIRSPEGYRASAQRRLTGEDAIWHAIDATLPTYPERKAFAKYFKAMRGADSPPVMEKVREAMLAEFPQHAEAINKHLTDEKIKSLWTAPKKKK